MNFQSQYAFVDDESIHINEYIKIKNEETKSKIKCHKGHNLVCVNGYKNKPHFRHKNTDELDKNPMTEWHCEWQGNFKNTEIDFKKKDAQIKDRRADVVIKDSMFNIEFQHSYIELSEVQNRKHDYKLHDRNIIWVIDGNNTVKVRHLHYSNSNRYYLEFISDPWKYENFIDFDFIFIDINQELYKIYPSYVKNCMIDVEPPFDKQTFIKYVNENNPEIYTVNIPLQCSLYIKQQGAGNGKTFGLIQNIESQDFECYKCFIIVSKQHSAKTIIYNELKSQIENKFLKHITELHVVNEKKKYQITYTNTRTGNKCQILIATIDSIMWSLGNNQNKDINKFEGIVSSIIDGYMEEQKVKSLKCNGKSYTLNKELCLIVDETQDLTDDYGKAIITIMRNRYIDSYIVGDRLQSITFENNAFQYLREYEFPYVNKIQYEQTNVCRRFYHNDLVKFVNYIVPFSKYFIPYINVYKIDDEPNQKHLDFIVGENVYANDTDDTKINTEVEKILEHYHNEVINNNYKPNDFLIITPFTTKNALVNALETAIEAYWLNKNNNNTYERYAFFHKSEEGGSINLSESDNATRIVSIHTSKGDGRNVVFVIGLDQNSLMKFSNEKDNLIYDSMIHVAFTRMKKKLYIRFVNNGDDISSRIMKYIVDNDSISLIDIKPDISMIKNKIKYQDIIDDNFKKTNFQTLHKKIIKKSMYITDLDNSDENIVIDMYHHNIRYMSMIIQLYIEIIKKQINTDIKKQIKALFHDIVETKIHETNCWKDYYQLLRKNQICILKIKSNGRDYVKYYNIIVSVMKDVQTKINYLLKNKNIQLCPLESIILYYMIQTIDQGIYTDITMNELYSIIDVYSKSFDTSFNGHDNCNCKSNFSEKSNETNTNIQNLSKYLQNHYENINNIVKIYNNFLHIYPDVNWLINHIISYNGQNEDFTVFKKFNFIGYDKDNVFIVYIKPQFNELNYNDILINSIYDTFLIKYIKHSSQCEDKEKYNKDLEDYNKFANRKIITVVFSLDNKDYKTYQWCGKNKDLIYKNNELIKTQIRNRIINLYINQSQYVFFYYMYYRKLYSDMLPKKFMKKFINKYKNDNDLAYIPEFVLRFFQSIQDNINSLELYDDKENFENKFQSLIELSVDEYLDFEEN